LTHYIQKQFLHVEFTGAEAEGMTLQKQLSELCHKRLLPALEQALNRCMASGEEVLRIDRLEIDIGNLDKDLLGEMLPAAVAKAVEEKVRERLQVRRISSAEPRLEAIDESIVDQSRRAEEILLFFLQNGHLPWYSRLPEQTAIEAYLFAALKEIEGKQKEEIAALLAASPSARQRLVWQFSPAFLDFLLGHIAPVILRIARSIMEKLPNVHGNPEERKKTEVELWQVAFASAKQYHLMAESEIEAALRSALQSGVEQAAESSPLQSSTPTAIVQDIAGEGIYIGNAGLVLLHPFLPMMFDTLSIAGANALVQPDRALLLLHFMATGQGTPQEHELVLPKMLCNIPLDQPVKTRLRLSSDEKAEAEALLKAVIQHWDALRNTSPDGLRGNFLCRAGKLSRRNANDWLLQVERMSHDVLLDRLPWGIGIIKLPWMDNMLWVEW
jgi:hypothetical protein